MFSESPRVGIIGLGYVGLPLAVEFGKYFTTVGYDINPKRIEQLQQGFDSTRELTEAELTTVANVVFSNSKSDLAGLDVYIVTVPTPIDDARQPDLSPLISASKLLGEVVTHNSIVVYESTVFPGCTEELCVPILEEVSGLKVNVDFFVGYSPERINPGDKTRKVHSIVKVTSGSTPEAASYIDQLYRRIVAAGTHLASSIKVAEAAKVIENTQRDINIALINELSLIFKRLNIDTLEVLEAAGTKWNFLPFRPGLVGGHCIGVDPYYLTYKAQQLGYNPEIILSGRRINDKMGEFVAESVVKIMTQRKCHVVDSHILVMGLTFKENCPDLRNTRVIDIVNELKNYNAHVDVYDPLADKDEALKEYNLSLVDYPTENLYSAIILCVAHDEFKAMGIESIRQFGTEGSIVYDVKYMFSKDDVDARL